MSVRIKPYIYQLYAALPNQVLQDRIEEDFEVVSDDDLDKYRDKICCILVVYVRCKVNRSLLESLPNLKVVACVAVGYNHIDVQACRALGIRVGYTPNVVSESTADMAVALLLSAARRVVEGDKICKDPSFSAIDTGWFGYQVSGSTVGIVGMGRIGLEIAKRLKGFNMKILYHNRNRKTPELEQSVNAQYIPDLYTLLSECDFVVLAAPATPITHHMFGEKEFSSMKNTGIFVNISRGSLVDHDALVKAIREETIRAVGLDVTDPEPLPRDHPLLGFPNVTITPHVGTSTLETRMKMLQLSIDNIWGALNGTEMPAELII